MVIVEDFWQFLNGVVVVFLNLKLYDARNGNRIGNLYFPSMPIQFNSGKTLEIALGVFIVLDIYGARKVQLVRVDVVLDEPSKVCLHRTFGIYPILLTVDFELMKAFNYLGTQIRGLSDNGKIYHPMRTIVQYLERVTGSKAGIELDRDNLLVVVRLSSTRHSID